MGLKRADTRRMRELRVEDGVKEIVTKTLVRIKLKWAGRLERMGYENLAKKSGAQKVEGKGVDEDRECDGTTALREIWKEWEENGEQQQKYKQLETVYRERSERKVRTEKRQKRTMVPMVNPTPDDRDTKDKKTFFDLQPSVFLLHLPISHCPSS